MAAGGRLRHKQRQTRLLFMHEMTVLWLVPQLRSTEVCARGCF